MKKDQIRLSEKVEHLECYTRINNVIISGLSPGSGENPFEIALQICNHAGLTVNYSAFDACHWLKTDQKSKTTGLIVRFVNRHIKEKLVQQWKKLNVLADKFYGQCTSRVLISDYLSPTASKLLKEAKKLKFRNQNKYKYVWTANSKILVRKDDNSKVIVVQNENDLSKL